MKLKIGILLVLLISNVFYTNSQTLELTKKDSTIVSSWIIGLGYNIVDDSDDRVYDLIDIKGAWNAVPYPSRISIGKYFKNGLGIEGIASYNRYRKGKIVDGLPLTSTKDYYAFDSRLSYDLNKVIGHTGWFDPYLGVGLGFTHANSLSRGTYNAVLGFRAWFSDRLGLDINTSGKWTMNTNYTNHIQHAVGVVYRFNSEKELTKKGEEKLALIEAEKRELARVNDSISASHKILEEKRLLAEAEEKKQEVEKIAQIEAAREILKSNIQNRLNALEQIYFPLDSYALTPASKKILTELLSILNDYPGLVIEVSSHTDSRGSSIYNQKLSENRMQSTISFLFKNGVDQKRIIGKGYGEDQLVNECDDHTKCSETKHKLNRRSEFKILDF